MDSFNEYREKALRTVNPDADALTMAVIGMTGELGEYAEIVKKYVFHQRPMSQVEAVRELGDMLWYLNLACHSQGVTLAHVAEVNIIKLGERHPERWSGDYHSKDNTKGADS